VRGGWPCWIGAKRSSRPFGQLRWCSEPWSPTSTTLGCVVGQRPGEWAIIEVVAHLADTEERALGRVQRMLAEQDPALEPFDQEALAEERHYLDLDLEEELARLERLRAAHLTLLIGLDGPGWERTGRHGEHGDMSLGLYETHVAAEEVDHLAQIARLL
jgi:hypothetical protein